MASLFFVGVAIVMGRGRLVAPQDGMPCLYLLGLDRCFRGRRVTVLFPAIYDRCAVVFFQRFADFDSVDCRLVAGKSPLPGAWDWNDCGLGGMILGWPGSRERPVYGEQQLSGDSWR